MSCTYHKFVNIQINIILNTFKKDRDCCDCSAHHFCCNKNCPVTVTTKAAH